MSHCVILIYSIKCMFLSMHSTALYEMILAGMYLRCCLMILEYEMKIQSIVILSALDISMYVHVCFQVKIVWTYYDESWKFLRRTYNTLTSQSWDFPPILSRVSLWNEYLMLLPVSNSKIIHLGKMLLIINLPTILRFQ